MIGLVSPLLGAFPVTQTFQEHIANAKEWMARFGGKAYNPGVDYGCQTGTVVYAAAPGNVIRAGKDATGYGEHVRILHDGGYMTLYAHLDMYTVTAGQAVTAGQMIGRTDNTGNSTGPHLHFELRRDGNPVDPQPYIGAVPEPTPPPSEGWPEFPTLKQARVLVEMLRIRSGPGTGYPIVGRLSRGDTPGIILMSLDGQGAPWVKIGWQSWCAWSYDGETLMEWA